MGNIFDVMYDVLFQPKMGMRVIADKKNIGQSLIVFFLSLLIPLWALYFGLKASSVTAMVHIVIGLKIIASLMLWIIGTAVWHLIAEFFGGRGTAVGLFSALGFAYFPSVLIVPLWVFAALLPANFKSIMMALVALLILSWSFVLHIVAIKEVYQFSTTKAVLVLVTPMLIMVLVGAVAFTFISSALIQMPMWL